MYPLVPQNKLEFSKVVPKNNATHHNKVHSKYRYRTGSYSTGNSHSWGMKNQKNCKSTEYLYCTYLGRVPEQEQWEFNDEERAEQLLGELHCQTEKLRGASKEFRTFF